MSDDRLDAAGVVELLESVAAAWAACDAEAAAALFSEDALYMEPPDVQLFRGTAELTAYFSPLTPGTFLDWHRVWFDEDSQTAAAEFTFGVRGAETADHGMVVIELEAGRIRSWREYPRQGPIDFAEFRSPDKAHWQWHAGNYP